MMKATVAIRTKCDGIGDLVGTAVGQHLHVVHFDEWKAVVGVKRRLIAARFAIFPGDSQNPSSYPGITREGRLVAFRMRISDRNISAASWLTILVSSSGFVPMAVTRVQKADASWLELSEGDFIVAQILKHG
jgi:hypothetical protein